MLNVKYIELSEKDKVDKDEYSIPVLTYLKIKTGESFIHLGKIWTRIDTYSAREVSSGSCCNFCDLNKYIDDHIGKNKYMKFGVIDQKELTDLILENININKEEEDSDFKLENLYFGYSTLIYKISEYEGICLYDDFGGKTGAILSLQDTIQIPLNYDFKDDTVIGSSIGSPTLEETKKLYASMVKNKI